MSTKKPSPQTSKRKSCGSCIFQKKETGWVKLVGCREKGCVCTAPSPTHGLVGDTLVRPCKEGKKFKTTEQE